MSDWERTFRSAVAGDAAARERMLAAIQLPLRAYVRTQAGRRLRLRESVSDVVQSVCRQILVDLPAQEFQAEPNFRGWALAVARRKLIDKARYHGVRARHAADLESWNDFEPELKPFYSVLSQPLADVVAAETQVRLEEALRALPELSRRVIMLVRVMGLSHEQASSQLGRSVGATRILLMRSLAQLAKALDRRRERPSR